MKVKKSNIFLLLVIIILLCIIVYLSRTEKNKSIGKDMKCELTTKADKLV